MNEQTSTESTPSSPETPESATETDAVTAEAGRLRARDRYDASRVIAPLARAADAVELDSTERGRAEVVDEIVRLYEARASRA